MPPSTDAFFEVRGARLRYRDEGSGPAMLLLHGWALDLELWEPQVRALASRYRMLRFDRRGFGLSSGDASLADDVEDLFALLDRLGIDSVPVVAQSQAARVALRAALARPGRIAGLVLDGPPDELGDGSRSLTAGELPLVEYRALVERGEVGALREAWARHPLTRLLTSDFAVRERLAEIVGRYPGRDLLPAGSAHPPALGELLRSLATPALIINGEHDSAARLACGALLCGALPNARRVLMEGAGHLANLDQPERYAEVVRGFVDEVGEKKR